MVRTAAAIDGGYVVGLRDREVGRGGDVCARHVARRAEVAVAVANEARLRSCVGGDGERDRVEFVGALRLREQSAARVESQTDGGVRLRILVDEVDRRDGLERSRFGLSSNFCCNAIVSFL